MDFLSKKRKYTHEQIKKAAKNSSGSIGKALELLEQSKSKTDLGVTNLITALSGGSFTEVILTLSEMPSDRNEAKGYLENCRKAIRDIIAVKSGREDMTYFDSPEDAKKASGVLSIKTLLMLSECLDTAYSDLNLNMNVQTARICLAKKMMRALCR